MPAIRKGRACAPDESADSRTVSPTLSLRLSASCLEIRMEGSSTGGDCGDCADVVTAMATSAVARKNRIEARIVQVYGARRPPSPLETSVPARNLRPRYKPP